KANVAEVIRRVGRIRLVASRLILRGWNARIGLPFQSVVEKAPRNLQSGNRRSQIREARSPIIRPRLRVNEQLDVLLRQNLTQQSGTSLRTGRNAVRCAIPVELC